MKRKADLFHRCPWIYGTFWMSISSVVFHTVRCVAKTILNYETLQYWNLTFQYCSIYWAILSRIAQLSEQYGESTIQILISQQDQCWSCNVQQQCRGGREREGEGRRERRERWREREQAGCPQDWTRLIGTRASRTLRRCDPIFWLSQKLFFHWPYLLIVSLFSNCKLWFGQVGVLSISYSVTASWKGSY